MPVESGYHFPDDASYADAWVEIGEPGSGNIRTVRITEIAGMSYEDYLASIEIIMAFWDLEYDPSGSNPTRIIEEVVRVK
jgi:hypothetical protein